MNDNLTIGSVTMTDEGYKIVTGDGLATITAGPFSSGSITTTSNSFNIAPSFVVEDILDQHIMNRVTLDHKIAEHELMKLKEVAPDYANEIKENLSKDAARDIIKKMTFTKKHDKDADVHHFIGRVWVFTEEELKTFINEVRNA